MKFTVHVELQHVSGPEQDEETMLDAFCATIGEQNGARENAVKVTVGEEDLGDDVSTYVVRLVDDRE